MKGLTVFVAALALCATAVRGSTLTGSSGNLDFMLAGHLVHFAPVGGSNLGIEGDFAGAIPGVPFPAELTMLDLASVPPPVVFQHGSYILALQLEPLTHSNGHVTTTGGGGFSSFFGVFFDISFSFVGPGSSDGSGDILGEFGSLPGISGCVTGVVSTCELRMGAAIAGNFNAAGNSLSGVSLAPAVPEPATIWLGGSVLLLLALRRRR